MWNFTVNLTVVTVFLALLVAVMPHRDWLAGAEDRHCDWAQERLAEASTPGGRSFWATYAETACRY